jgi:hypothetical protein
MVTAPKSWTEFPPEFHEHVFFTVRSDANCSIPTKSSMFPQTNLPEERREMLWNAAYEFMAEEWYDLVIRRRREFAFDNTHSFVMKLEYVTSNPHDNSVKLYCFSFNICPIKAAACRGLTIV